MRQASIAALKQSAGLLGATIGIGDEVVEVQKDDVVYIPANVPHWYRAEGNEPFEFLCMVPNLPDETKLIDEA